LEALEKLCKEKGMEVNVVRFSLKRKTAQPQIKFNNKPLETLESYKYLGLEFIEKLSWEHCISERLQGGWKATYLLQNKCRTAEICNWKIISSLLQTLITPVLLYGSEVWGPGASRNKWRRCGNIL
jgi:hypothetical protein